MQESVDRVLRLLPLAPEDWSKRCEEYAEDIEGLTGLVEAYRAGGPPAWRHMLGVLLAVRADIDKQIIEGAVDKRGHDLTEYLRAQRLIIHELIALPDRFGERLSLALDHAADDVDLAALRRPAGPEIGEEAPADLDNWPTFGEVGS